MNFLSRNNISIVHFPKIGPNLIKFVSKDSENVTVLGQQENKSLN